MVHVDTNSVAPSSTSDKTSFAYVSARDRWPVIVVRNPTTQSGFSLTSQTGAIDDIHRAVSQITDEVQRDEGKRIIENLAQLKYELQHDRKLT
jgi:coenzyme F420-reducing hydrogenase beta subunit